MIEANYFMGEVVKRLKTFFEQRLLFVGLQGSYKRNEARPDSDFDIVVVLDQLSLNDLAQYRSLLRAIPQGDKACGFICGQKDLLSWPKFELFQFYQDTDAYHGRLENLLPPLTDEDLKQNVKINAANLYHALIHLYVFGEEAKRADELKALYKNFFFLMQAVYYLRCGTYIKTKAELMLQLTGEEAELLKLNMDAAYYEIQKKNNPDLLFEKLLQWCSARLRQNIY